MASKVEKIKKLYQPKDSANIPALEEKMLRAKVAQETNKAY